MMVSYRKIKHADLVAAVVWLQIFVLMSKTY